MIKVLRKAAVAVMFSILIVAFALWGVNDYVNRQATRPLAKVGNIEITPQQFEQTYQRAIESLRQRSKQRITPQEARAFGLPQRVIQSLVQDAALDLEARKLGLGLSSEGLRENIFSNDMFQDESGKFSRQRYEQFLQRIGYSAPVFEYEFRGDLVRRQLRTLFDKSAVVPDALLNAYNRYFNEQRTISYFRLPPEAVTSPGAPPADALQNYYNDHKGQFTAPEYRKVSVAAVSPETVRDKIQVSDDELKAAYDAHKENYAVPERRKIEMIPFQTKKAADEAAAKLNSGKDFLEVAKEAGFKQPELDLGLVSKKELGEKFVVNDKVKDAVFSLAKGKISAPVDGPLSTVILRVLEIVPAQEKSFDEVKDQIKDEILKTRVTEEMSKLTKAFEDERTAGVQIPDIAKKLGLPLNEVTLNSAGLDPEGKAALVPGVPASNLATAAFKSDIGVENEALRLPSGGYAWFDVTDIVKARQKPLDEVKADVETAWRREETRTKVNDKAQELTARLYHGEAIADVAKSIGAEVQTSKPLKRNGAEASLPNGAVSQAFSLGEGAAGSTPLGDGTSRIVFQVSKVMPAAPLEAGVADSLRQRLTQLIAADNFATYVAGIEAQAGATIDEKALATIAGGSSDFTE